MRYAKFSSIYRDLIAEFDYRNPTVRYRAGSASIHQVLDVALKSAPNFCVCFLDEDQLIGYILAWPDTSFSTSDEEVVFLNDIAILPEYRNRLFGLVAAFLDQVSSSKYLNHAIETITRAETYSLLNDNRQVFHEAGYKFQDPQACYDDEAGEELYWQRIV